ncbi:hypothetical protein I6Y99_004380 [Vibrio parahaemolyticus]|nr:hypothetical protein [Vibrio parahaemolyticus]
MEKSEKVVFLGYAIDSTGLICSSIQDNDDSIRISIYLAVGTTSPAEAFDFAVGQIENTEGKVIVGVETSMFGHVLFQLLKNKYEYCENVNIKAVQTGGKPKKDERFYDRKTECLWGIYSLHDGAYFCMIKEVNGKLIADEDECSYPYLSSVCSAYSVMEAYEQAF